MDVSDVQKIDVDAPQWPLMQTWPRPLQQQWMVGMVYSAAAGRPKPPPHSPLAVKGLEYHGEGEEGRRKRYM